MPIMNIYYEMFLTSPWSYWLGISANESLQRIAGVSFPEKKLMDEHKKYLLEAAKRNHRKIGQDQKLFFFDEVSPGSCFFLPRIDTDSYDPNGTMQGASRGKGSDLWEPENNTGWKPSLSVIEASLDSSSLYDEAIETFQRKSGPNSIRGPIQRLGSTASNSSTRNRLRSLFKPKSAASSLSSGSRKRYAPSQFTYNTDGLARRIEYTFLSIQILTSRGIIYILRKTAYLRVKLNGPGKEKQPPC
jgi:hypothetical protein